MIGPYPLQDFHLYYTLRFGYAPAKVAFLAWNAWRGKDGYRLSEIRKWLGVFLHALLSNQPVQAQRAAEWAQSRFRGIALAARRLARTLRQRCRALARGSRARTDARLAEFEGMPSSPLFRLRDGNADRPAVVHSFFEQRVGDFDRLLAHPLGERLHRRRVSEDGPGQSIPCFLVPRLAWRRAKIQGRALGAGLPLAGGPPLVRRRSISPEGSIDRQTTERSLACARESAAHRPSRAACIRLAARRRKHPPRPPHHCRRREGLRSGLESRSEGWRSPARFHAPASRGCARRVRPEAGARARGL